MLKPDSLFMHQTKLPAHWSFKNCLLIQVRAKCVIYCSVRVNLKVILIIFTLLVLLFFKIATFPVFILSFYAFLLISFSLCHALISIYVTFLYFFASLSHFELCMYGAIRINVPKPHTSLRVHAKII